MLPTISLDNLATVSGGAAVTADNFMSRAQALKAAADSTPNPTAEQKARAKAEFCGNLVPYARSGKPISGMFGEYARSKVLENGAKYCK